MRVAIIAADTHMPARARRLPAYCALTVAECDLVVHAGDVCDAASLAAVRAVGPPVVAVRGNVDSEAVRRELPETAEVDLEGLRLGVIHDAGPERGRLARQRRCFPAAAAVVFGHSHIPYLERGDDGLLILNPGSPTDRRRQPRVTMAVLELVAGRPPGISSLAVDDPPGRLAPELVRRRPR